jgi:molybdate transport system substrate-binding protein
MSIDRVQDDGGIRIEKWRRRRVLQSGLLSLAGVCFTASHAQSRSADVLRIAAASDLKFVLPLLLERFHVETGVRTLASYGSSGNFARQIRQGLPVDLFMSADEGWVDQLAMAGMTRGSAKGKPGDAHGVIYGRGRIVGFVPNESELVLDPALQGLKAGWGKVDRFAIANPEHAPYGRAAKQALETLGLWALVKSKLVLGENIAQTTQFIATGAAQAGITALSLAMAPEIARLGRHVLLPETLHAPLRQRMVMLKHAAPATQQLFDFLQAPTARDLFRRYGFTV